MREILKLNAKLCSVKNLLNIQKPNIKTDCLLIFTLMNLTDREHEILELIAKEYTSEKIADYLHISLSTVETHRRNIFQKLEVNSVVGLVKVALKKGLIKI
jgi:DNA-binding CsgD family transcriptional regulator